MGPAETRRDGVAPGLDQQPFDEGAAVVGHGRLERQARDIGNGVGVARIVERVAIAVERRQQADDRLLRHPEQVRLRILVMEPGVDALPPARAHPGPLAVDPLHCAQLEVVGLFAQLRIEHREHSGLQQLERRQAGIRFAVAVQVSQDGCIRHFSPHLRQIRPSRLFYVPAYSMLRGSPVVR